MQPRDSARLVPIVVPAVIALAHLALTALGSQAQVAFLAPIVIFYGLGASLRGAWRVLRRRELDPFGSARGFITDVLVSAVSFTLVASGLALVFELSSATIAVVVDGSVMGASVIIFWRNALIPPQLLGRTQLWAGAAFAGMAALSTLVFALWMQSTPYPIVPGWDMHAALVSIHFLISHQGFAYILVPPFPAGSEIPYPGMFLQLVGGLAQFLGWDPLLVYWWAPWFLVTAFMGLTYLVALRLSGRPLLAFLLAIIGIVLSASQPEVVRSPFFLQAETVAGVFFLMVLAWFMYADAPARGLMAWAFLASLFLGVFYFYTFAAVFPFLAIMILGRRDSRGLGSSYAIFGALWGLSLSAVGAIALLGVAGNPVLLQFVDPSAFPLSLKLETLSAIYIPVIVAPLALAAVSVALDCGPLDQRPFAMPYFAVATGVLLIEYLMPVWVAYRLEFYVRMFVLFVIAGAAWDYNGLLYRLAGRGLRPARRGPSQTAAARALLPVVIVVLFIAPGAVAFEGSQVNSPSRYSFYSSDEYYVSQWVVTHLPHGAYLATDPGSGYLFRSLASRNASYFFILPDGRAPSAPDAVVLGLMHELWLAFNSTFVNRTTTQAVSILGSLGFPATYLLITTRTCYWTTHANEGLILTAPVPDQDPRGITSLFLGPHFTEVFNSSDVYVVQFAP